MTDLSAVLAKPGRNLNIALWVVQALLAAAFLAAGGLKLAGVPHMVALFDSIGLGTWFRYFTGALEVAAALALLVPRAVAYAAGVLLVTMVCAVVTHLFVIGGSPLPAVVLAALSGLVAYRRWPHA